MAEIPRLSAENLTYLRTDQDRLLDDVEQLCAVVQRVLLNHVKEYNKPAGEADEALADLAAVFKRLTGFDATQSEKGN